jgi:hypothetical protein
MLNPGNLATEHRGSLPVFAKELCRQEMIQQQINKLTIPAPVQVYYKLSGHPLDPRYYLKKALDTLQSNILNLRETTHQGATTDALLPWHILRESRGPTSLTLKPEQASGEQPLNGCAHFGLGSLCTWCRFISAENRP